MSLRAELLAEHQPTFGHAPLTDAQRDRMIDGFDALTAATPRRDAGDGRVNELWTGYDDVSCPITRQVEGGIRTFWLARRTGRTNHKLFVEEPDGRRYPLADFRKGSNTAALPWQEGWNVSQDGTLYAFVEQTGADEFASARLKVHRLSPGGKVTQIIDLPDGALSPIGFTPDGRCLVYTANVPGTDAYPVRRTLPRMYDLVERKDVPLPVRGENEDAGNPARKMENDWVNHHTTSVPGPPGTVIEWMRMATTCGPGGVVSVDLGSGEVTELQQPLKAFTRMITSADGTVYGLRFRGHPGRGELIRFDAAAARAGGSPSEVLIEADGEFVMVHAEVQPREGKKPLVAIFERWHGAMSRIRVHDLETDTSWIVPIRDADPARVGPEVPGAPPHTVFGRIDEVRFAPRGNGEYGLYYKLSGPNLPPQLFSTAATPGSGTPPVHVTGTHPAALRLPEMRVEPYVAVDRTGDRHHGFRLFDARQVPATFRGPDAAAPRGHVVVSAYAAANEGIVQGFRPAVVALLERGHQVVLANLPGSDADGHSYRLRGIGRNRWRQAEALNAHGLHAVRNGWTRNGTLTAWLQSWAVSTLTLALRLAPKGLWDLAHAERGVESPTETRPGDWDLLDAARPTPKEIRAQWRMNAGYVKEPQIGTAVILTHTMGDKRVFKPVLAQVYRDTAPAVYLNAVDNQGHIMSTGETHERFVAAYAKLSEDIARAKERSTAHPGLAPAVGTVLAAQGPWARTDVGTERVPAARTVDPDVTRYGRSAEALGRKREP